MRLKRLWLFAHSFFEKQWKDMCVDDSADKILNSPSSVIDTEVAFCCYWFSWQKFQLTITQEKVNVPLEM